MNKDKYLKKIGNLIAENRQKQGMTQAQLAEAIGTSQSAINRIENGGQNISIEMVARISEVLNNNIMMVNHSGKMNFRVHGGKKLSGEIRVNTSKNAAVGLLCASLLNKGKTTLRKVARIEEVNRIIEVLNSIGVKTRWLDGNDLEIMPPARLKLENMDIEAAKRTRTVIMFLDPLLQLGGASVHMHQAGNSHYTASSDEDALDFVADLVGYLPSNNREFAPISDFEPEEGSLEENMNPDDLRLDSIIPDSPTVPYDVREVIESVTDDGEYLEIQADRAENVMVAIEDRKSVV